MITTPTQFPVFFSEGFSFIDKEIRALSWKNPYGPLMMPPALKKETRTWNTKYRGIVLLCCSQQNYKPQEVLRISGEKQFDRITESLRASGKAIDRFRGNAFAVGILADCHRMRVDEEDECFVAYNPDLFVHVYRNVVPIDPFPFKGRQGWSTLTQEIKSLIKLQK